MKIVILGNTNNPITRKKDDPYSWFVLTFNQGSKLLGHDVFMIDYRSTPIDIIKQKLYDIKPDIMFTHLTFHLGIKPLDVIMQLYSDIKKKCGTKVIHITMDARKDDRYMDDLSDSFYMAFVGNYEMLERGRKAWNIPAYYTPYSSLCYDKMSAPSNDLSFTEPVFTGSPNSHPDRSDFIQKLQKKIPIRIFQTQSKNDLRHRTPELSSSAKCILGLCTGYDVEGFHDVRYWQFLGTGACFIARKFTNTEDLIPENLYFGFDGYGNDAVESVIEYHKRALKENTNQMQQKAFDFIQKYHSCKARMNDMLDAIEGKKEIPFDFYNYLNFI